MLHYKLSIQDFSEEVIKMNTVLYDSSFFF